MNDDQLLDEAKKAAKNAYSPYSQFRVGAALLCNDGSVIIGTNVENRSFGLTICAERTAFAAAVSLGYRCFKKIAIYALDANYPLPPCGACRQVLSELTDSDFLVIFSGKSEQVEKRKLKELLPFDALHELKNREI